MKTIDKGWVHILVFAAAALLVLSACAPSAAPTVAPTKAPASAPAAATTIAPTAAPKAATVATAAPAKPKEALKLRLARPHPGSPTTSLPDIAATMGYFKDENLEIEPVFTAGGGDTLRAMDVAGGADLGLSVGPMSILGAVEKGADLKIISAARANPDTWWISAKGSPYKTVKDLEGKPVAFSSAGSSSDMQLRIILDKEGVKADAVAAGGDYANIWTQTKTGQLAAGMAPLPEAWAFVENEGGQRIFSTADYPEFQGYTTVVNVARGDAIKNKPEAIKAFHRALKRAADLVAKDPAAAAKAFKPSSEMAEALIARYFKFMGPGDFAQAPVVGMDLNVKYAKIFKFITQDPDLNKIMDLSLVSK